MLTENITYVWNDVACLNDDRAVTFVCKTLFQLPAEITYCQLDQLSVEEIRSASFDEKPCGELCLTAVLVDDQTVKQRFSLVIPFAADGEAHWQNTSLHITYLQGQLCQDRLLVEAVMSHQQEQFTRGGGKVILGELSLREVLELQEDWPGGQQVLGSQVLSQLDQAELQDGQRLYLSGNHLLAVLYETEQDTGEKIFIYQEARPFQAIVPLTKRLGGLVGVHLEYQSLTVQLIAPRKILLNGIGVLFAEVNAEEAPIHAIQKGLEDGEQQSEPSENRQEILRSTVEAALQEVLGKSSAREAIGAMLSGVMANRMTEASVSEDGLQKQQEEQRLDHQDSILSKAAEWNASNRIPESNIADPTISNITEQSPMIQEPAAEAFSMKPLGDVLQMEEVLKEQTLIEEGFKNQTSIEEPSMEERSMQDSLPPEHRPAREKATRISQREQLAKHMRNLNGMVRDPYYTKNFELQQQRNQEESDF